MAKHWRSIKDAAAEIKAADPGTVISYTFIRELVLNKKIPHAMTDRKYIVSIEDVQSYLEGGGTDDRA